MNIIDMNEILNSIFNQFLDDTVTNEIVIKDGILNNIKLRDRYIAMQNVLFVNENNPNYPYASVTFKNFINFVKDWYNDYDKVMSLFPKELLDTYDIKSIGNNTKLDKFERKIHRNTRDSILIFTNLSKLNVFINDNITKYNSSELANTLHLNFRLLIPQFLYRRLITDIECNSNIYLYKSQGNKIEFSNYRDPSFNNKDQIISFNNTVSNITNNGTCNLDFLPESTVYCCYFTISISELSKMITLKHHLEKMYDHKILGSLYYNLIKYDGINKLLNVKDEIGREIVKDICERNGY